MCESKLGVYRSSIVSIIATTAVVMKIKVKITYTYKYKNELALFLTGDQTRNQNKFSL